MKLVDFISIFFILVVVLVIGHVWLTWQGSVVADANGNYDLRTNVQKPVDDFSKAYESSKPQYKATFENTVKATQE